MNMPPVAADDLMLKRTVACVASMQIAFSSVSLTLQHYLEDVESGRFRVHHGVIVKKRGAKPNEPGSFVLENHIAVPTTVVAS